MIQGATLPEIAQTILANAQAKRDFVLPTGKMRMSDDHTLTWDNAQAAPSDHAHGQIADYLGIPRRFYERIRTDAPDLISVNVNRLLMEKEGERRMVRTMGETARAFLSDRYRRLDNEDIAEHILPMVLDSPDFNIQSMQVTESRFYMQVVTPKLEGEVRVGDQVQMGWVLQNSEIGIGSLSITPMIYRLRCTNGMIVADQATRKAHLGSRMFGDDEFGVLTDETRAATDKALWLQVRDHVSSLNTIEGFNKVLAGLREAADDEVTADPQDAVEELGNKFSLREPEKKSILYSFLHESDHTRWGLANAVTQVANSHESYDRAVQLEAMGGQIMALTGKDWKAIAKA